jgi:hypothetical protein
VVGKVPFPLPAKQARFVSSGGATGLGLRAVEALVPTKDEYVAIVSHDCEFNEEKRKHFLVARIDDVSSKLTDEELEQLFRGNDIEAASAADEQFPLDTFMLDPLEGVFDRPRRINFCTITPYSIGAAAEMRKLKQAELEQETRALLRRKLGLFFARDAEDVPDEEKTDRPDPAREEP